MALSTKSNHTLLITEDVNSNFDLLKASVGRNFTRVLHACNGIEAVELCKYDNDIAMVLMDISMPDMNGYDATRLIKQIKPDLPVIALTAYINDDTIRQIKDSGCDDFMLKPFQIKDLQTLIRSYTGF
ncbi:MAG: response regulator [Bacteroidota bacterium]